MIQVDDIIDDIIASEGGFVSHHHDHGGPTKFGITKKALQVYYREFIQEKDVVKRIQAVTESEARQIYLVDYFYGPKFDKLPNTVMPLVVDSGVLHGSHRAAKWLQKAVGAREDGYIGKDTLAKVGKTPNHLIFNRVLSYRLKSYGRIVSRNPTQASFILGWINRAVGFLET